MTIKMVGLDLDGTALAFGNHFTQRTKEAFKKARNQGVHIVIATGRAIGSLPEEIFEMEGLEFIATSNGAVIINRDTREVLYENYMSKEKVLEVRDLLKKENIHAEIFRSGRAYIGQEEYDLIVSGKKDTRSKEYVMLTRNPVPDIFDAMTEHAGYIENISVNYRDTEERDRVEPMLGAIEGITLTSSFYLNNEMGGATTNKGDALTYLMNMLDIDKSELMCCGDSPNDIAMLRLAGLGVAMGNAEEEVKEIADVVTDTCMNDGVALAIEEYVLK